MQSMHGEKHVSHKKENHYEIRVHNVVKQWLWTSILKKKYISRIIGLEGGGGVSFYSQFGSLQKNKKFRGRGFSGISSHPQVKFCAACKEIGRVENIDESV